MIKTLLASAAVLATLCNPVFSATYKQMSEEDEQIAPIYSLVYYHDHCNEFLTDEEYLKFRRQMASAPQSVLGHAARIIINGERLWGEYRYCHILTGWIKQELPEFGVRFNPRAGR